MQTMILMGELVFLYQEAQHHAAAFASDRSNVCLFHQWMGCFFYPIDRNETWLRNKKKPLAIFIDSKTWKFAIRPGACASPSVAATLFCHHRKWLWRGTEENGDSCQSVPPLMLQLCVGSFVGRLAGVSTSAQCANA